MTITRARIIEIRTALNEAGNRWQEVAAGIPEIAEVVPGSDQIRDVCVLGDLAESAVGPIESDLYRNDVTGEWWATGWSSGSKAQLYRTGTRIDTTPHDERG